LENRIYLISAVTEKDLNLEEKAEAEAKAGSSKTRPSTETTRVSATNLASTCSVKESQYPRDDSNEDIRENHEECEYSGFLFSC
jgi:hypothetical protein